MLNTAIDMHSHFKPSMVYVASDEITLVFPRADVPKGADPLSVILFGGRTMKIVSVFAGYCSARFNFHIAREEWDSAAEREACLAVHSASAHFDARVFNVPSDKEAAENIHWRMLDAEKNSRMMLAQHYFRPEDIHRVTATASTKMLQQQRGVDWEATWTPQKYGAFIKSKKVYVQSRNPKTGEAVQAERHRPQPRCFPWPDYRDPAQYRALLYAHCWDDLGDDGEAMELLRGFEQW